MTLVYVLVVLLAVYGLIRFKLVEMTEERLLDLETQLIYFKRLFLGDKTCLHHHTCSSDGPKNTPKRSDLIDTLDLDGNEIFDINMRHKELSEVAAARRKLKEMCGFDSDSTIKPEPKPRKSTARKSRKKPEAADVS